jgi:hypothetical protein
MNLQSRRKGSSRDASIEAAFDTSYTPGEGTTNSCGVGPLASQGTMRCNSARACSPNPLAVVIVLLSLVAACDGLSGERIVAPQSQRWVAAETDSHPQLCAAWACRTMYPNEEQEITSNLDFAWYTYVAEGRWTCANLIMSARSTMNQGMVYVGQQWRMEWDPRTGQLERVVGEADANHGSIYVDMDYMRQLGTVNGYILTMLHEQFHLEDPNLQGTVRDDYDWEPPALRAENDCTI